MGNITVYIFEEDVLSGKLGFRNRLHQRAISSHWPHKVVSSMDPGSKIVRKAHREKLGERHGGTEERQVSGACKHWFQYLIRV